MIKDYKNKIMIPYEKDFIQDKEISDRVYSWILLMGRKEPNFQVSVSTNLRKAYIDVGMNYRTFHRKINYLLEKEFIKKYIDDNGEERYITLGLHDYRHKIYINKDILETLYKMQENNAIKIYIELIILKENENFPYFNLDTLAKEIGYNKNNKTHHKIEKLIRILKDLGLITYEEKDIRLTGQKSKQKNYLLTDIKDNIKIKEKCILKLKDLQGVSDYLGIENKEVHFLNGFNFIKINSNMDCEYIGLKKNCHLFNNIYDCKYDVIFAKIKIKVLGEDKKIMFPIIFNATENNIRVCNDYIKNNKSDYGLE